MTRARDLADFNLDGKAVTINESSADLDFRVESNGNANMLVVDAGNDRVGIGTSTVDSALHIEENASGVTETSGSTLKIHNTNASGRSKISLHNSAETASGSIYYDTDSGGLALQGDTGAVVAFHTNGNNERGRFDTSGRFLVGKTTSSISDSKGTVITDDGRVDINPSTTNGSGQVDAIRLHNSGTTAGDGAGIKFSAGTSTTGAGIFGIGQALNSANLVFRAGGDTERMRIDSSGNVLMNTTSVGGTSVLSLASSNYMVATHNDGGTSGFFGQIRFRNNANSADVGTINRVNDASVQYNTTSDARLKENIADMVGAIARVKQLAPKRYSWVNEDLDAADQDGFLAHEAQTVVPVAVSGTQNEVEVWQEGEDLPDGVSVGDNKLDSDGNTIPVFMQMDYSKLVPLLTGALKEAIAKIETLETKVAALEAK